MGLIRWMHYAETAGPYARFIRACGRVEQSQRQLWRETQPLIANGVFWQKRMGSKLRHLENFDLSQYSDYEDTIRHAHSTTDLSPLTGEKVPFWMESSASTGRPKLYPAPQTFFMKQCMGPPQIVSYALLRRFPRHLEKAALNLVATSLRKTSPVGVPTGLGTYNGNCNLPAVIRWTSALPLPLYDDAPAFQQWAPLYAMAADLSSIRALSPSRVHRFLMTIVSRKDELLPYLDGRLTLPRDLPPLRVSKERVKVVRAALERPDVRFKELWPTLEFIRVWKCATCGIQTALLAPHLTADVQVIDHIYGSSEGALNCPILFGRNGGPALVNTLITEYVKVGDDVRAENLIPVWKLEAGCSYRLFVTNKMGLVRYRLGDIIRCTGHFRDAPIIEFSEREAQELAIGGAIITEGQLVEAAKRIGLDRRSHWVFAPNQVCNGLVFYFDAARLDGAGAARQAEEVLRELNPLYSIVSKAGTAAPIKAAVLPPDHAFWTSSVHAQTKERVLLKQPMSEIIAA